MCSCAARCKQECYLYGTTLCVCSLCSGLVLRRKHGDGAAHIIPEQRNAVFQYAVAGAVHHALANQVGRTGVRAVDFTPITPAKSALRHSLPSKVAMARMKRFCLR